MMKSYHSSSSSWCWLLFPEEWCDVIVRCCFWNDSYKSVFFEVRLEWKLFSQNLSKCLKISSDFALETTQNCASFIQYYISLIIIIFMEASTTTSASKTPADFLKSIRGKRVVVKLNSGVDYRGILIEWMNFAVSQGRRKKEIVRSFVRLLLYYTTTLVHINRGVVRDIDTSSSSSSFCKTGILACLDGYMNIAMEHTEVRTDCRLFS